VFKAILFDLDGTLLDIDMDFFLQKYFGEMGKMAASQGKFEPKRLIEQLLLSTEVMINDLNPETTNEVTFMQDFIVNLGADEFEIRAFLDEFYSLRFPRLKEYCSSFEGVPEMMTKVFEKEIKVVIATNSVFPLRAIRARLDWAGVGMFPYELLTCYENMHYCKPYPQYYEEIVERIGVDPAECLMVVNDTREDLAAGILGIKTFLVEDRLIDKGDSPYLPNWRGNLHDLFHFIGQMK
jgi:FMN phosphatase YigB (HAD superfamily)